VPNQDQSETKAKPGHEDGIEEVAMTIASLTRRMTVVLAALFLTFALAACEEQGTAQQTGEAIDDAVEKSADMVEEGAEKVEEEAEKVQENAE